MAISTREILYCFTADTDSDSFFGDGFPAGVTGDKSILGWKGLEKGKDVLAEMTGRVTDSFGKILPITWFVRCDGQIKAKHGRYDYLLDLYQSWWENRLNKGDDIQWHAHLYHQTKGRWEQETDGAALGHDLEMGLKAIKSYGIAPSVVRMGEAYHSNELMSIVEELGLKADSTALPGRKRVDEEKLLDWEETPNRPYQPSLEDYRIPGSRHRSIWEIPMNTVWTKVSYDRIPLLRYVNPGFHPRVLHDGVESFLKEHEVLVSIVHPFEILPGFFKDSRARVHPLLSFQADSIMENVMGIVEFTEKAGRKLRFVTMKELVRELESNFVSKNE